MHHDVKIDVQIKLLEGGLFRENFSQKVPLTLNPKNKWKINRGRKMRTKRAPQTKETASVKAVKWEGAQCVAETEGGQTGGQEVGEKRREGFHLRSGLEPGYNGPCWPQEAAGSQQSRRRRSMMSLSFAKPPLALVASAEWSKTATGGRVRGAVRRVSSNVMKRRGNIPAHTQQEVVREWECEGQRKRACQLCLLRKGQWWLVASQNTKETRFPDRVSWVHFWTCCIYKSGTRRDHSHPSIPKSSIHAPVSMDLRKDKFRKENNNLQQDEFEITS